MVSARTPSALQPQIRLWTHQPSSSRGSTVQVGSLPERQTWISSSLEVTRLPWLQKFKHPDFWTFVPSQQSHCWRSDDEMDPCSLFLCVTVPYFCYPESGGFDWTLIGCFLLQSQGDDWLLSLSLSPCSFLSPSLDNLLKVCPTLLHVGDSSSFKVNSSASSCVS